MEKITVDVFSVAGKKVGSLDLNPDIFSVEVKPHLVKEVVRWQRAKRRSGTHQVLNRARIGGSGKKPFAQKGTGNARAGSRRSPLWRGGAVIHGPQNRSYDFKLTKKHKIGALTSVLSDKLKNKCLIVVDKLELKEGKTKEFNKTLDALKLNSKSGVSIVPSEANEMLQRAIGNLKKVDTYQVAGVNVYDLLNRKFIVIEQGAIQALEARILNQSNN